jgi:diguanylate cyclase (GGDEF)-like protein/PAS domain S-box-containing protein
LFALGGTPTTSAVPVVRLVNAGAVVSLLHSLIDAIPDLICIKDAEGRWLVVNRAALQLLRFDAVDWLGKTDAELAAIADVRISPWLRGCAAADEAAWLQGSGLRREEILTLPSAEPADYDVLRVPLFNPDGSRRGLLLHGRDISAQKADERAKQALMAFDSTAEGIMVTDAKARIVAVNQAFTRITGYSESDVIGKTPKILHSGRHDVAFFREMRRQIKTQGHWQGEIWNRRKNGEIHPEWLTIYAVKDEENRIFRQVASYSDISANKHAQDRLHSLANRDPLTNLPNRRLLIELMGHALRRAERDSSMIAVLFVDLDRFKAINDTLGHLVGDKLLLEVAKRLAGAIRDSDTVARLGGDEFLVMMYGLHSREEAALVAKKLLLSLQVGFHVDGRELYVGASIGISVYPSDASSVDDLIKMADIAMYQVKNSGKNNYCYYSHDFSRNAEERLTLDVELRHALERNQFELYYQPRVSLKCGKIIGAEALVRWHHPELGMVEPSKFIPLAEETGLIVQIGEWVLREAAQQIMIWVRQGYVIETVSVNVSGVQIQRSHFADTVYGVLLETECREGLLELEITESTVMHNTAHVSGVCDQIRQLGVRLAIDDFGTGYSSLSHLKRLPLDKLKIDQSFVRDLPQDEEDAVITRTIRALGHNLGLAIVAEGVETAQQHAFLRDIGCDEAQGYYYGKPVPAAEFSALLQKSIVATS